MIDELRKVIERLHYPLEAMLVCVRWYAACPLSLRHIKERMIERGVRYRAPSPKRHRFHENRENTV